MRIGGAGADEAGRLVGWLGWNGMDGRVTAGGVGGVVATRASDGM